MKYGETFEAESVLRWSLYNIDYNSLKQLIKLHTTKGQATAIAIPGQVDHALERFENDFYNELCDQHDRVGLFVTSKADEISRRLSSLSAAINKLLVRCTGPRGFNSKCQARFAKYQQQLAECGDDIRDLQRFVRAQVTALRKILKKHKKWTGSTSLWNRFNENVLGNYKSFTRRDFHPLQFQYRGVQVTLQTASPAVDAPIRRHESSDTLVERSPVGSHGSIRQHSRRGSLLFAHVEPQPEPEPVRGWNEYDDGSEAGDDSYYIELDPNDPGSFPGMETVKKVFGAPVKKIRNMFSRTNLNGNEPEHRSLLSSSQGDYFSIRPSTSNTTDADVTEDEDASSTDFPTYGYSTYYAALPSIEEQRMERYKEVVLHRCIVSCYFVSVVLAVVASVLVGTGRHRLRLEVDAGVTLAVVVSLFSSCIGLGAMLYRTDKLGILYQTTVWTTFGVICVLNGMLLVLVAGNTGL